MAPLTNAQIRDLKAQAQRLKATLKVGKEGLSPQFLAALDDTLKHHELVKVKFDEFKEQKKELAPQLAEKSRSHLVTRVGNVAVLYRPKLEEEKQPARLAPRGIPALAPSRRAAGAGWAGRRIASPRRAGHRHLSSRVQQ